MKNFWTAAGGLLACAFPVAAHAEAIYDVTLIEPPSFGGTLEAYALNDSGVVVGRADGHAMVWDAANGVTSLAPPGDLWSTASDINNNGQVVFAAESGNYVWSEATGATKVSGIGSGRDAITSINDSGEMAGTSSAQAVRWSSPTSNPETLDVTGSEAKAINADGVVVGERRRTPVLWGESGIRTDLSPNFGEATDITDSGVVVGWDRPALLNQQSFLWRADTGLETLARPENYDSDRAYGANESLQVVGQMSNAVTGEAYIWDADNGMRSLNDLIDEALGLHLVTAWDINERGQIITWGSAPSTYGLQSYLLTPGSLEPPPDGGGSGAGSSEDNPLLPDEVLADGGFVFELPEAEEEETVWLDPEIAVGYTYSVENAEFFSIIAPSFETIPDLDGYVIDIAGVLYDLGSGEQFFFDSGITEFVLRGIDVSLGLDPGNEQAFPLGVAFTNIDGTPTLTQTPITEFVDGPGTSVPEPGTLVLLGAGLGILGVGSIWRRQGGAQSRRGQRTTMP